ncbi:uncharacterized protein LOC117307350 [Asterias rubens]|nr:uncharacterized protein LOC117307350 [Asterias rubens]
MYQTLQGVFVTVESTTVSLCIACNSREPSPSTHFYKCKVCNCKQLVSNMKKNTDLKGKFKPLDDSPLIHLSLNNHQLTWLPDTDVNNIDDLEEQLLQTSMTITYNKVNNYVETTSPIDSV